MRVKGKGIIVSALALCMSGAVYAQGAGGAGAGAGGGAAGRGGTGMGTPNAQGTTESPSAASGGSTMENNTMGTQKSTGTHKHRMRHHKKSETTEPATPSSGSD